MNLGSAKPVRLRAIALVASVMNERQIVAGAPAPKIFVLPSLSRSGFSSFLLPTQTAAASFFVYPTIQACALSTVLWPYCQVPVLPAEVQPLLSLAADTWLST